MKHFVHALSRIKYTKASIACTVLSRANAKWLVLASKSKPFYFLFLHSIHLYLPLARTHCDVAHAHCFNRASKACLPQRVKLAKTSIMLKGALLDLDGTLMDSMPFHFRAWNVCLEEFGKSMPEEEYRNFAGFPSLLIAEHLVKKNSLAITLEELFQKKKNMMAEIINKADEVPLMGSALEALDLLQKNRLKLAIVTGSPRKETMPILKKAGISERFGCIVTCEDAKSPKPSPECYLFCLEKMKLEAQECAAFEDSNKGTESARSAGLWTFAIPNKYSRNQDFSSAHYVCKDLLEAAGIALKL